MMNETQTGHNHTAPFVGRQTQFVRLKQHVLDPPQRRALVFTGHDGMGKTTLLLEASKVFEDPILTVFTALSTSLVGDESAVLDQLVNGINARLAESDFSMSRIPEQTADDELKPWFAETYLPTVLRVIRPHRRIVWLIDEAQYLVPFAESFIAYLHELLVQNPQFAIALSISTAHEDQIALLEPLASPALVERIHRLNEPDSIELIRKYAPGASDTIVAAIYQATGGHPGLLARYGNTLRSYWASHTDSEAFERAKTDVYEASQPDFRKVWSTLSRDERLVLTAIVSLIYDDPLQTITPAGIEAWLIETDYALDIVAIQAVLRSLDYQDIVIHQQGQGIRLTMGLMQKWLFEQARLDAMVQVERGRFPLRLGVIVAVVILILILLLIFVPPQYLDGGSAIATATLSN